METATTSPTRTMPDHQVMRSHPDCPTRLDLADPASPFSLEPATPDDTDDLVEMFEAMSPENRRLRFFQSVPRVRRQTIETLCDVDQVLHRAWLLRTASRGGSVVGEVRAVIDAHDPRRAEVALAVHDDWAGIGLGRALLEFVADVLRSGGVRAMTCEVLPENRRSIDLFASLGARFDFRDGVLAGEVPLATAVPVSSAA